MSHIASDTHDMDSMCNVLKADASDVSDMYTRLSVASLDTKYVSQMMRS